ncbi:MAG: outer membrane beta-barrel protein [Oleiphilus sp.]
MICRLFSAASFRLACLFLCLTSAFIANAQDQEIPAKKDRTYISGSIALHEFRSLSVPFVASSSPNAIIPSDSFPLTAQTYSLAVTYGTYITENFRTELRMGKGVISDTVDKILEIKMSYYFNWYIGGTIPVTDYLSAYALAGVSFYDANIKRKEDNRQFTNNDNIPVTEPVQPYPEQFKDGLFGTKFSMSWLLGFDYKLNEQWYLGFEYGRLLSDTDTNIKVYQASSQLRYEF